MNRLIKDLNDNSNERTEICLKLSQSIFNNVLQKSIVVEDLRRKALKEFSKLEKINVSEKDRDEIIRLTKSFIDTYISNLKLPVNTDSK
ncbi:TPA: hypothetical protein U3L57_000113 [Streptococcus agalactiae]|nr:hypothetical protein [Streptococcus agalactiae]